MLVEIGFLATRNKISFLEDSINNADVLITSKIRLFSKIFAGTGNILSSGKIRLEI